MEDPPEVPAEGAPYLEAFWELDTCRELTMGIGPIPWRDLHAYAQSIGLDSIMETLFRFFIRQLDAEYLDRQRERIENQGTTPKKEPISPTGRKLGGGRSKMKKMQQMRKGVSDGR